MTQRIKWIDVARCLGIFAIYLSHFGEDAGKMYSFLYTHHVPLFFFLSGCLLPRKDLPLGDHAKKIAGGLLLPWIMFALAAAVFDTIYLNNGLTYFMDLLKQIALGTIVNQFVAGGLWFLVCLAIMRLAFWFLRKLRASALILAVCLVLFWMEATLPIPKYYNLHRVLRLMIYYAAGFYCFPLVSRALSPKTYKGRLLLSASGLAALAFSALVYFGRSPLAFFSKIPVLGTFVPVVQALIIIWLYLVAAKYLEDVELLNRIGKKTLYLCGCEYFARQLLKSTVRLFGLELSYPRPICAWICAALTLYVAMKYLVPVAEQVLASLRKFPNSKFKMPEKG